MTSPIVHSLSHLQLTCPINQRDDVLSFYRKIGFTMIETSSTHAVLHVFQSDPPANLVIKFQQGNTTGSQLSLVLSVSNIDKLQKQLKETNVQHSISHEKDVVELVVIDPLGTMITMTNKVSPFSLRVHQDSPNVPISLSVTGVRKKIAFLTSGGDSCGMNASNRAIVRTAISMGCEAWAVYEGYQGLVDGGSKLVKFNWEDVSGVFSLGGTVIGSARCKEFRERPGRLQAAFNMISNGIDSLIVNGGDGSLTGADLFRSEWPSLLDELVQQGKITRQVADKHRHLTIVGMVGSIDNDMVGTELTIGANTALHRIIEAVDSISSTAMSHQRAFVVEVMGRHCGWLAVMAAIATGADYIFIPECPATGDWQGDLCNVLKKHRDLGKRKLIVIVAEGAIDSDNKPIRPDQIKDILTNRINLDTRITLLGHVQRGGVPSAMDRILATLQGIDAVHAVLESTPDMPSPMIGMNENKITRRPLMECVQLTKAVAKCIEAKNHQGAFDLRDPDFKVAYQVYKTTLINPEPVSPHLKNLRVAVLHCGAPSAGMNAATRAIVRYGLHCGYTVLAVSNGFDGLIKGLVKEFKFMDVDGWVMRGGSDLGVNRSVPEKDLGLVACKLQEYNIQGLIVIGGFEAFSSIVTLSAKRSTYPAFRIPLICLPATISNNVPGTEYSIGSDTALNVISESCDIVRCSASASRNRVFVVEVQGAQCGYLATMGGLISGAVRSFIAEEGVKFSDVEKDIRFLRSMYKNDIKQGRILLRNEDACSTFTTDVITNILMKEGKPYFDARSAVLGHLQQGSSPSPLDRVRGTRLAVMCMQFIEKWCLNEQGDAVPIDLTLPGRKETAVVIGIKGPDVTYSNVEDLVLESDMKLRRPKEQWWMYLRPWLNMLSRHDIFECVPPTPK